VDSATKQIFWVTDNTISQRVRTSDFDGRITTTILRGSKGPFTGLTIDAQKQRLYWIKSTDNIATSIFRSDLSGRGSQEVVTASFITSIGAENDQIFWAGRNAGGNAIFQADINGQNQKVIQVSDSEIHSITIK